jgi:hypothetical protein
VICCFVECSRSSHNSCQASDWAKYGEGLSLKQEEALEAVRNEYVSELETTEAASSSALEKDAEELALTHASRDQDTPSQEVLDPSSIHTKAEFYAWYSNLEATRASQVEAKYKEHTEVVEKQIDVCNELLGNINAVLDIFSQLKTSQRAISGRTDTLKAQCDRLVSEREKLASTCDSIKERLKYFDRLETLSTLFHAPVSAKSDPQKIIQGLKDLEASLDFTNKHPEYLESAKYHARFVTLQARAMSLVKSYFQESMAAAVSECKIVHLEDSDARDSSNGPGSLAGPVDTTIQDVKFRAVAEPRLKELLSGICNYADGPIYQKLLEDCSTIYCKSRFELVRYNVLAAMQRVTGQAGLAGGDDGAVIKVLEAGSDIIAQLADSEIQLYCHIFSGSSSMQASKLLSPLFDSMCILLAAVVEPNIYATLTGDLGGLCRVNEYLMRKIRHSTLGAVFDVPSLNKLVQGVEQMILRQARILWRKCLTEGSKFRSEYLLSPSDKDYLESINPPLDVVACELRQGQAATFPPVECSIEILRRVRPSLRGSVELELIRDIIPNILDVVQRAAQECSELEGEAQGAIFALKQLSLLSECLGELKVVDMGRASDEIIPPEKRGLVSSLSAKIPLLASFSSLGSRSSHGSNSGISGAEIMAMLDKKLVVARDFCFLACAQDVTNPLLSFLTKVTAAKVSGREHVKSHAFATLERAKELSKVVRDSVQGPLLINMAIVYMVMPESERMNAVQTIKSNLEDAQMQMQDVLAAEYEEGERNDINFISFDETKRLLFGE